MKRTWKGLLVLVAALMAVAGWQTPAWANTELVPGSRLVFPYLDVSSGRETFVFITNAGEAFGTPGTSNPEDPLDVHLEFYSQTCSKTDKAIELTHKDLDVIVVSDSPGQPFFVAGSGTAQQAFAGIGWLDVDIRDATDELGCSPSSLAGCPSIEYNGLMGMAVILDVTNDFAMAYPAAASQGSSGTGGISGTIVDRTGEFANDWEGAYETYPSTIMVPGFFAEDPCTGTPALRAFISVVSPADAWRKEAPGADLGNSTVIVNLDGSAYDGDENGESITAFAHMVNGRLCTVFADVIGTRNEYEFPSDTSSYPTYDVTNGEVNAVGWLELSNTVLSPWGSATQSGFPNPNPNFNSANDFDDSIRPRGIVGLLWEIQNNDLLPTSVGGVANTGLTTADTIRFWADPATQIDWPCFGTEADGGIDPPTVVGGLWDNSPTCRDEGGFFNAVNPSWLGDHAATLFGGYDSNRGQAPTP